MSVRILPEADGESLEAALWYEDRRSGLGDEFLAERAHVLVEIGTNPQSHTKLEFYSGPHEIRRVLLRRFPYAVIYACRPGEVLVVAVAHTRRRPLYWLGRIG